MQYKNLKRTVMKKALLFAVSICCMISAVAQNVNNYIQKLDSVCYGSAVERLQYDERLNCTQIKYVYDDYGQEEVYSTHNFAYDNENRVVRDEYIEMTGVYNLYENTYNEQGLVAQRIRTMKNYDELLGFYKYTYEYDTEGNLLMTNGFNINENNEWIESYRNEYHYEDGLLISTKHYRTGNPMPDQVTNYSYNEQRLCVETTTSQGSDVVAKTIYTYDELGRKTSETKMSEFDGELEFTEKMTNEYDAEGNCSIYSYYHYIPSNGTWLFSFSFEYVYDFTVPIKDIAGIFTYRDNSVLPSFSEPNFKILNYQKTDSDGHTYIITFHYSEVTGVGENLGYSVLVWPNPAHELLHFDAEDLQQVEFFTIDGKPIMTTKGSNVVSLNVLAQGCYLLKVTHFDGRVSIQKFVKK